VERLAPSDRVQTVGGWSADGRHIVYSEEDPTTRGDIWMLPMAGERRPQPLVKTEFDERIPSLSPDGRWLAYTSDETGRSEVYVQAFPGPRPRRQVSDSRGAQTGSPQRGSQPARPLRWSRDGRELFYWNGDRLMSVAIRTGPELDSGVPRLVFEMAAVVDFDVAPDGRRFLLIHEMPRTPLKDLVVALGGATEIGRRTP
jgi:dipeptidyl aminopeptidase/acylaminoacyl peptidase